jgi:hypothetical protein
MKYDGMKLEELQGMMGELGIDAGTATQSTLDPGTVPTGTHTATGTSSRPRGALRLGEEYKYQVRELTPEEVAKVGNYAKVQGVKLSPDQSLYVPIGTAIMSDGSTSGGAPVVQGSSAAAAGAELTRAVEAGELTPSQASPSFFNRRFLGFPVWLWGVGGAVAVGGVWWFMRGRSGK